MRTRNAVKNQLHENRAPAHGTHGAVSIKSSIRAVGADCVISAPNGNAPRLTVPLAKGGERASFAERVKDGNRSRKRCARASRGWFGARVARKP